MNVSFSSGISSIFSFLFCSAKKKKKKLLKATHVIASYQLEFFFLLY